jgi:Flp pilus assembly pilin Flp
MLARGDAAGRPRRWRDERGQTFTEYVMVLGLLTAIIASLTGLVVPGLTAAVMGLIRHMSIYISSVQP